MSSPIILFRKKRFTLKANQYFFKLSKDVRMCYWLDLVPGACSVDDTVELEWEDARKVGGCPADGRTNSAFLVCGCGFV